MDNDKVLFKLMNNAEVYIYTYMYAYIYIYILKLGEPKLMHKTFFTEQTFRITYIHHLCIKTYLEHRIHIQLIVLNKSSALYRNINPEIL